VAKEQKPTEICAALTACYPFCDAIVPNNKGNAVPPPKLQLAFTAAITISSEVCPLLLVACNVPNASRLPEPRAQSVCHLMRSSQFRPYFAYFTFSVELISHRKIIRGLKFATSV
jgi:hypothetical protein